MNQTVVDSLIKTGGAAAVGLVALWLMADLQKSGMQLMIGRMDLLVESMIHIEDKILTGAFCRPRRDYDEFSSLDFGPAL